ncbi:MAG: hypothetical protein K6E20_00680 [Acholeplasmatales bacterium]|nr:hypothetical protein [Acholeplasmatales bacterium]
MNEDIIELYRLIKKIINKFNKNEYFDIYSEQIFSNIFSSIGKEIYVRISNSIYGRYTGIEIFFNNRGFNFLHDSLLYSDEYLRYDECDSVALLLLDSEDVSYNEGKYIHSLGMKIKKNDNVIIYRNKYGKKSSFANYKEARLMYINIDFLSQMLVYEKEDIVKNQELDKVPFSFIDSDKNLYTVNYYYIRKLEWLPKPSPSNLDFVKEYQNKIYNPKESYLLSSFYPMVVKENGTKPLLISFLSPDDKIVFKYITGGVSSFKKVFFGLLDEIFSELKYLPSKIYFDNRDLYQISYKTLDDLNIEHELIRNITPFDAMAYVDEEKESEMDYKKQMNLDSNVQPKEVIETFLNFIVTTISSFKFDDLNLDFDDLDDLDSEDDVSNNNNDTNLVM